MGAGIVAFIFALIAFLTGGGHGKNHNQQSNRTTNNSLIEKTTPGSEFKNQDKSPTEVPTPALLPGLIGLGIAALRKRKSTEDETSS